VNITPKQLDMMTHCVAADRTPGWYRNHYCVNAGSAEAQEWDALVADGLAERGRDTTGGDPYATYRLTEEGKGWVRAMVTTRYP
jgi:hypothetical protein